MRKFTVPLAAMTFLAASFALAPAHTDGSSSVAARRAQAVHTYRSTR